MTSVSHRAADPVAFRLTADLVVRALVVAGLVIDAYIHLKLAPSQPPGGPGHLGQVALFNAEGAVAIMAAALVLLRPRTWTYLFAVLIAGTALAAVLISRYADIGAIGPIPNLYEPAWYTDKVVTTVAEGIAFAAAALLLVPRRA